MSTTTRKNWYIETFLYSRTILDNTFKWIFKLNALPSSLTGSSISDELRLSYPTSSRCILWRIFIPVSVSWSIRCSRDAKSTPVGSKKSQFWIKNTNSQEYCVHGHFESLTSQATTSWYAHRVPRANRSQWENGEKKVMRKLSSTAIHPYATTGAMRKSMKIWWSLDFWIPL